LSSDWELLIKIRFQSLKDLQSCKAFLSKIREYSELKAEKGKYKKKGYLREGRCQGRNGVRPNSLHLGVPSASVSGAMARKPRIELSGALYHVIVRGNQRQEIFHDAADYRKYLSLLWTYKERYPLKFFAYTLMSNHVHLIIETGETPLSKVLQGLNQSYTQYYNLRCWSDTSI
jgi:hypothetical protein